MGQPGFQAIQQPIAHQILQRAGVHTVGDLQGGIEEAERQLGYKVMLTSEAAAQEPQN